MGGYAPCRFWSGAAISLTPVCVGDVCRVQDYGTRTETAFLIVTVDVLLGVLIGGAIIESEDGMYRGLVLVGGALYGAALCAYFVARGFAGTWSLKANL